MGTLRTDRTISAVLTGRTLRTGRAIGAVLTSRALRTGRAIGAVLTGHTLWSLSTGRAGVPLAGRQRDRQCCQHSPEPLRLERHDLSVENDGRT